MFVNAARRFHGAIQTFGLPTLILNAGNAVAFLFQFFLVHALTLEGFGHFNAVFSALNVLWTPSVLIPLVVSSIAVSNQALGLPAERRLLSQSLKVACVGGAALTALAAFISLRWANAFDLSLAALAGAALATILLFCQSVFAGLLQARRAYVIFSFVQATIPLLRPVFGVLLVSIAGFGVDGAIWSCTLPIVAALGIGMWATRDLYSVNEGTLYAETGARAIRLALPLAFSLSCIAFLSNVDLVIVRMKWPGDVAGYYSAAAVLSRIVLLVPSAVVAIIFSEATHGHPDARTQFMNAIGISGAMAGAIALVFVVAGDLVLRTVLGAGFEDAATFLRLSGPAMAALVVAQTSMMYSAGRRDFRYIVPASLGCLAFVVCASLFADSPLTVAWMLFAANIVVAAFVFALTFVPVDVNRAQDK